MNRISIVRVLAFSGLSLGGAMLIAALVAALNREGPQLSAFLFSGLMTLVMAGMVLALTGRPKRPARVKDGLAAAILWCIGTPIPAAIPFVFGTAETSVIAGLHEAVSCLTTTGHSVVTIGSGGWPASLLVWRGLLHLYGMMFSLIVTATVFAAIGFAGPGVHRSVLFTLPDGSFFDALPRVVRLVGTACMVLILAVFAGLVFSGIDAADALSRAISVASTGLVDPRPEAASAGNWITSLVLFIGLLFATAGMIVMLDVTPSRIRFARIDPELTLLIALVGFAGILAGLAGLGPWSAAGWAMSALSTSGLPVWGDTPDAMAKLPTAVLILPALIGGAALSTAGGIKLARIVVLIRRAGQEFARLGYQRSVVSLVYRNRHQDERAVLGVWVYVIAYIAAATAIFVLLSLQGSDFSIAMLNAIGSISNSGWMIAVPTTDNWADDGILIAAMILGRLEVIALLPALSPAFWRI